MSNKPAPINQFRRLELQSGVEPTGNYVYGSPWNNYHNGQSWDARNCTAAMGAVAIDAHTGGRITSNPAQIRNHQSDWSGGIGLDDVNDAWRDIWGSTYQLILPTAHDWYDTLASVKEGRFVIIQGDYDQVPWTYQCQKGGTFDHAFGLAGYRASDSRVLRYDPLCGRASWVPQSAIRGAAEKLARTQRRDHDPNKLFVGLTKVMPPPYISGVTYRYGGQPVSRGRWLARRDDVPVRSGPGTQYGKVAELDHRDSFACRQAVGSGDARWLGTADGQKWVYRQVMWYAGGIVGNEDVK